MSKRNNMNTNKDYVRGKLSVAKCMRLYLYIAQVNLEGSPRVGSVYIYVINEMQNVDPI